MNKDKITPVVVYKGKPTKLEPFMIFTHENERYMASGWDVDEEGDDVYLTYKIEANSNRVLMGEENQAQSGEVIPVDCMPHVESEGWEYVEEEEHEISKNTPVKSEQRKLLDEKITNVRKQVAASAENNKSRRADLTRGKQRDESLSNLSGVDERSDANTGIEPSNEVLNEEINITKDPLLGGFLGLDDASPGEDVYDGAMDNIPEHLIDAIMDDFNDERVVRTSKDNNGLKSDDRKEHRTHTNEASNQRTRRSELSNKGYSEKGANPYDEEMRKRKAYKEVLDTQIKQAEDRLNMLNNAYSQAQPTTKREGTLASMFANPTPPTPEATVAAVPSAEGTVFDKIAALQSINQDDIIDNAVFIAKYLSMSAKDKSALNTLMGAVATING